MEKLATIALVTPTPLLTAKGKPADGYRKNCQESPQDFILGKGICALTYKLWKRMIVYSALWLMMPWC